MHEIDPQMGKEPVVPRLGKKKALLIGISYYSRPAIDDFGRLDGPQRDARQFERLLIGVSHSSPNMQSVATMALYRFLRLQERGHCSDDG